MSFLSLLANRSFFVRNKEKIAELLSINGECWTITDEGATWSDTNVIQWKNVVNIMDWTCESNDDVLRKMQTERTRILNIKNRQLKCLGNINEKRRVGKFYTHKAKWRWEGQRKIANWHDNEHVQMDERIMYRTAKKQLEITELLRTEIVEVSWLSTKKKNLKIWRRRRIIWRRRIWKILSRRNWRIWRRRGIWRERILRRRRI